MNENGISDNPNKTTEEKNARSVTRRALLFAFLALPFAAIVEPEPAHAQFGGIVGGIVGGIFGGHRYHYHNYHSHRYHGGGRHYSHNSRSRVAHHGRPNARVAHKSHGGGHHYAGGGGGGGPSGPGSGSFH